MRRALIISLALHLALGVALTLGLVPPRALPVEETVTVELVAAPETGPAATAPAAPAEAAPLPPREAAAPAPRPEPPPDEPPPPSPPPQTTPAPPPPPPARPPAPQPKPAPVEKRLAEKPATAEPEPAAAKVEPPRPVPRPEPPRREPPKTETAKVESAKPAAAKPAPTETDPPRPPSAKPKPPKPTEPAQEDGFAALLRSVERLERRVRADQASPGRGRAEPQAAQAQGAAPRADQALSQGEIDAIRRQIERCWNVPVGVRGIETMQVRLRIAMNRDGSVARVGIEDQARMLADPAFRTVAESAQRAVLTCQLVLPAEKYDQWREMVMTFHPKDALSG